VSLNSFDTKKDCQGAEMRRLVFARNPDKLVV
jgi:hypothetical protein